MIDGRASQDRLLPAPHALGCWMAAFVLALALDGPVARLCQPIAHLVKQSEAAEEIKEGGHFALVLILAVFIWILHPSRLRGAVLLCVGGMVSGLFYTIVKWVIGRPRPVVGIDPYRLEPFVQGLPGFLHASNLSFPSGHTCLAFATATCLSYLLPRATWAFYGLAVLVAAERVGELAHYLSDTIAGAAFGILAFRLTLHALEWLEARRRVHTPASAAA